MSRRGTLAKPQPLGEILAKVMAKKNIPHEARDPRLLSLWQQAVGPIVSAQTHPVGVRRTVLQVRVSSPVWLHQLQFLKEEIIGRLNELSPSHNIRQLKLVIGEIPAPRPEAAKASRPDFGQLTPRDRSMIRESLSAVRDEELREIIERVMKKEIGRRRSTQKAPGR